MDGGDLVFILTGLMFLSFDGGGREARCDRQDGGGGGGPSVVSKVDNGRGVSIPRNIFLVTFTGKVFILCLVTGIGNFSIVSLVITIGCFSTIPMPKLLRRVSYSPVMSIGCVSFVSVDGTTFEASLGRSGVGDGDILAATITLLLE